MDDFGAALAAIRELKDEGIVADYAVGGAMAYAFWTEPTPTFDLDVFVLLDSPGLLVDLGPIYEWARRRGYREVLEHIEIEGIPVQLIPANALAAEAIANAAVLDYEGKPVRVITREYLVAMYLEPSARTHKRLARVAALQDEGKIDHALLARILEQHHLKLP